MGQWKQICESEKMNCDSRCTAVFFAIEVFVSKLRNCFYYEAGGFVAINDRLYRDSRIALS